MTRIEKRVRLWRHVFEEEESAIVREIVELGWKFAGFSAILAAVENAPVGKNGGKQINGIIGEFVANGFWVSSFLAFRRLLDSSCSLHGPRAVCSLGALIADVVEMREHVTRRVYVEVIAGLPYNYELARDRYWSRQMGGQVSCSFVELEARDDLSLARHQEFDWLSGCTPGNSTPDDKISAESLAKLETRLRRLQSIAEHATLRFAHSATEMSRKGRVLESWKLDEAKAALKEVCELAELVGRWFCYSTVGGIVPTAQFDKFLYFDRPFHRGPKQLLEAAWQAFVDEASSWTSIESHDG